MDSRTLIVDHDDVEGVAHGPLDGDAVTVRLPGGDVVTVPWSALAAHQKNAYRYPGRFRALLHDAPPADAEETESHRLPLAHEELDVRREVRPTGRVRVARTVHEHTETVDEPVVQEAVEVRRVPIGRVVEAPVPVREEGDTVIIPVLEERLVVTRQLVLKEEVHVVRRRSEHRTPREVTLRSTRVEVEREDLTQGPPAATSGSDVRAGSP